MANGHTTRGLRYQLVEVVYQRSASCFDGRSRLPLALWYERRNASYARRASDFRVLHQNRSRGRSVDEWKQRPEQPDNHWFDCLVGSAVAASMQGVILPGIEGKAEVRKERMSFSECKSDAGANSSRGLNQKIFSLVRQSTCEPVFLQIEVHVFILKVGR